MKKNILTKALALLLVVILCVTPAMAASNGVVEARNGVVRIMAIFEDGGLDESNVSFGSGFGIGEVGEETDTFVTNCHVLVDELGRTPVKIYILLDDYAFTHTGIDTSRVVPCSILWISGTDLDLAVLESADPVEDRVALPLREDVEDLMEPTDGLWVLGYPGSGDYMGMINEEEFTTPADVDAVNTASGSLSKFEREASTGTMTLVHNANMNGGNSGGPTVDEDGVVIGINTFSFGSADVMETAQSASISVEELIHVLNREDIYWEGPAEDFPWLIVALAALAVILAAVVIVILVKRGRKPAGRTPVQPAAQSGVQNAVQNTPMQPTVSQPRPAPQVTPAAQPKPAISNDSGLRFQALSGVFAGKRFAITGQVRIGRNPANNDFVYPADTQGISGNHCSLRMVDGKLYLKDEGSSYGTFLSNGQRLAAGQAVELQPGDRFYLATTKETFQITRRGGV